MEKALDPHQVQQIVAAVQARLGQANAQAAALIAQEVAAALGTSAGGGGAAAPGADSGLPPETPMPAALAGGEPEPVAAGERIVVSANGRNRSGIVARLTAVIHEFQGDIRDISQTIVGDYFTMLIVVDIGSATRQGVRFADLKERLQHAGTQLGVHVVALHDDLLTSMHSV